MCMLNIHVHKVKG